MHISYLGIVIFYLMIGASIALMFAQLLWKSKIWLEGKPIDWKPRPLANILQYILGQRKVRSSRKLSGAPMHLLIFYGFLVLLIATTLLAISSYTFEFHKGTYFLVYEWAVDVLGFMFVIGITWAMARRLIAPPPNMAKGYQDWIALIILWAAGVGGYLLEAARMVNNPQPWDRSAPIGFWMSTWLFPVSNSTYAIIWWSHMVVVALFFAFLPQMRIRHIVTAIFAAGGKPDQSMGELKPITLEEVEETGQIGVSRYQDYSQWHLLSLDACMECGRCTDVCPANNVGKVLNPKMVVQDIIKSEFNGKTVAETVSAEALWACTTCNACVEACPVLIRHVDMIVDARRNLVAEGQLSGTAATMLRQLGSTGHAWGQQGSSREDWMKGLDVPLARNIESKSFDVLFWVGCAGATDPGAVKTTRAVAQLLKAAGIDFACLGVEEQCTGDPARRVGDEFLFQQYAEMNVGTFNGYTFKRIVTPCPHCFNTLKNEYTQFQGNYEVLHHTEFLARLIDEGKLKPARPVKGSMVYHDPCYLARANNISDAPRKLVGEETHYDSEAIPTVAALQNLNDKGKVLAEPEQFGRKTLCCGAGGGRMWMDESPDQRPSDRRMKQLLATGADTVAVACPFCRIMLDSAVHSNADTPIRLLDLAEVLAEANIEKVGAVYGQTDVESTSETLAEGEAA